MERGRGAHDMFTQALPGAAQTGQMAYEKCYGSDKSAWKFNTRCCAYNRQDTDCKTSSQSPPLPEGIVV